MIGQYYLYIIQCGDSDYYKIGVSDRPKHRLEKMQTANPYALSIKRVYRFGTKLEAYASEAVTHRALSEHKERGEWFELKHFKRIIWDRLVRGEAQQLEHEYKRRLSG